MLCKNSINQFFKYAGFSKENSENNTYKNEKLYEVLYYYSVSVSTPIKKDVCSLITVNKQRNISNRKNIIKK